MHIERKRNNDSCTSGLKPYQVMEKKNLKKEMGSRNSMSSRHELQKHNE